MKISNEPPDLDQRPVRIDHITVVRVHWPARQVREDLAALLVEAKRKRRMPEPDPMQVSEQGMDGRRVRAGRTTDGVPDPHDANCDIAALQRFLIVGSDCHRAQYPDGRAASRSPRIVASGMERRGISRPLWD
jgi:hypothetical protein